MNTDEHGWGKGGAGEMGAADGHRARTGTCAAALVAVAVAAVGCRSSDSGGKPGRGADGAPVTARVDRPANGDAQAAAQGDEVAREESARFFPEPYDNLWIGESLAEFRGAYPEAVPYAAPADPERLEWQELRAPTGLVIRLGFTGGPTPVTQRLRSVQFMSLLPTAAPPPGEPTPETTAAWQAWMVKAYEPLMEGLRQRYGEKADVYSCGGGAKHPIVRIVWRGKAIAVTEVFMLHDKGLSSTLMITPLAVVDRYLEATQCRWVQDRVL